MSTTPESSSAQVPRTPLPAPTGRYPVGRVSYDWIDPNRTEMYSADPSDRRELVVWMWYPAAPGPAAEPAVYLPAGWAPSVEFLGVDLDGVRTHAVEDAPVADEERRYPVLLLSPSGFPPLLLAAIAEELASHGNVVVGVNHSYETAVTVLADGRVLPANPAAVAGVLGPQTGPHEQAFARRAAVCDYKAADLASVADQLHRLDAEPASPFSDRLDLARLGALGHSFGGNAALEWCRTDRRCRAAANLDGALWTEVGRVGLDRPALQVLSEHGEFAVSSTVAVNTGMAPDVDWFEAEKAITFGGWHTVQRSARPGITAQVVGATHISFMDVPFLPLQQGSAIAAMLARATIQPQRMWRITSDLLLAFFAQHLDGKPSPSTDQLSADYPEVVFGAPDPPQAPEAPKPPSR